jgi:hypothetical protein
MLAATRLLDQLHAQLPQMNFNKGLSEYHTPQTYQSNEILFKNQSQNISEYRSAVTTKNDGLCGYTH